MRCPICKKPVEEPAKADPDRAGAAGAAARPTFPFCSERCKLIDLGRWLDGKYQVPVVEPDESLHEASHPASRPSDAD